MAWFAREDLGKENGDIKSKIDPDQGLNVEEHGLSVASDKDMLQLQQDSEFNKECHRAVYDERVILVLFGEVLNERPYWSRRENDRLV